MILKQHVRGASLDLRVNNLVPEPLSFNSLATFSSLFIRQVKFLKLGTVTLRETRALVGAHKSPVLISLDSLHEEVRNPKGVEEITGSVLLITVVFSELEEVVDISMPRLEVDSKGAFTLATTLVDVTCSVIVNLEHGDETITISIGAANVTFACTDIMDCKANTTSVLTNDGTLLESIVNSVN